MKRIHQITSLGLMLAFGLLMACQVTAQKQMEYLDRGVVATTNEEGQVFISWRLLGTETDDLGFNVYRQKGGQEAEKLNSSPLISGTNFTDKSPLSGSDVRYFVRAVESGKEQEASKAVSVWEENYLSVPLKTPEGYSPNDLSVGDLNGDGQYELIVHMTGRGHDNSHDGYTDDPIFHAYTLEGEFLWEINLGKNIREGAHYTQFIVVDMDGDGRAELLLMAPKMAKERSLVTPMPTGEMNKAGY